MGKNACVNMQSNQVGGNYRGSRAGLRDEVSGVGKRGQDSRKWGQRPGGLEELWMFEEKRGEGM